MSYNGEDMVGMSEADMLEQDRALSGTVNSLVGDLEELENILVRLYTRKQQGWGDMQPSYMTPKDLKGLLERGIHLVGKIREDSIPVARRIK